MDSEKNKGDLSSSCCGGPAQETNQGCGCGCDPRPRRQGWIRTAIFAVVMLAAVAVGAYALKAKPQAACTPAQQDCSSECGSNCCGQ